MEPLKTNWESIGLSNDFLFGKIMRKPALCKRMLEIILGIKIDRIEYLESQKSIDEEWDARSIRLDIYVQDNKDIAYNIEIQTTNTGDLPKRSRYYQSVLDMQQLNKGERYRNLKRTYIIFICTFDPFGRERYRYTFVETCREDGELLEDGTCKIFLNTKGKIETGIGQELVRFLKWIGEPDAGKEKEENDLLITKLRTQITDLKKNRRMEENYMLFGEMLDEERRQGQKEGLQQGKMDILLKLLQEHKIDVKTAASIMGMNEDEFAKAVKECQEV